MLEHNVKANVLNESGLAIRNDIFVWKTPGFHTGRLMKPWELQFGKNYL